MSSHKMLLFLHIFWYKELFPRFKSDVMHHRNHVQMLYQFK